MAAREKGANTAPATPPPAPMPDLLPAAAVGEPPPLHAPVPSALLFSPAHDLPPDHSPLPPSCREGDGFVAAPRPVPEGVSENGLLASVVGAVVGDAAATGVQWVYDPAKVRRGCPFLNILQGARPAPSDQPSVSHSRSWISWRRARAPRATTAWISSTLLPTSTLNTRCVRRTLYQATHGQRKPVTC